MDSNKKAELQKMIEFHKNMRFHKRMDFENYLITNTNKKAVKTVRKFMERRPGYRAVLIYGSRMCGKTHLARAVWTKLLAGEQEVLMRNVDQIMEELQGWLWAGGTPETFYENYEKRDFLIVDDIQNIRYLGAMKKYLEEIVRRFLKKGKSVLLVSSQKRIGLKSLRYRFLCRVEIKEPDLLIRMHVIREYEREKKMKITKDAKRMLAQMPCNMHLMERVLNRALHHQLLQESEIDADMISSLYEQEKSRTRFMKRRKKYGKKR